MNRYCFTVSILFFLHLSLFATEKKSQFSLYSADFRNNAFIPFKCVSKRIKGGGNLSPSFFWKNPPKNTQSFAFICIDLNPIAKRWIHWMVINIPSDVNKLKLGASIHKMPTGTLELKNSFRKLGWGGPSPPKGSGIHRYVFKIYALNTKKISKTINNEKEFYSALKGKIIAKAKLVGLFMQN